ncbi:MAG: YbaK/EbsC family protein [Paracoccaceae bacterium]|nr:YbaK/EbsC family protein [Paracoccaceae bacterium]
MSKSKRRVESALVEAGIFPDIRTMPDATRTAAQAAEAVGCQLDQIAKSIIFRGENSGQVLLFLTAGGNSVDPQKAGEAAGEPLGKADAAFVRDKTGFAIGGVSPVGHLTAPTSFFDPRLLDFAVIWAAAGTPHAVFSISPRNLLKISAAQVSDFT